MGRSYRWTEYHFACLYKRVARVTSEWFSVQTRPAEWFEATIRKVGPNLRASGIGDKAFWENHQGSLEEHLYFRKGAHAIWIRLNFATASSWGPRSASLDQAAHQKWRSIITRLGALAASRMPAGNQADHDGPPPTSSPGRKNPDACPPNCGPANSREGGSGYRFDSKGNMIATDGTGQTDPG